MPPSRSVINAGIRRAKQAGKAALREEWFINEVSDKVSLTLEKRMKIATELYRNQVVKNISKPVTKVVSGGRTRVTERSKPGEYPRADTTQLLKTIFSGITKRGKRMIDGWVGTPLDYGVILELKMDRSFLVRTLRETKAKLVRVLTGPLE